MADRAPAPPDESMSSWVRWTMGILGFALAVVGSFGIFIKDASIAGVPVAILVGVALLYCALSDQRLIQIGKDGATFTTQALKDLARDPQVDLETKARIVEVAEENGIEIRVPEATVLESVAVFLDGLGNELGFTVDVASPDFGVDLVLRGDNVIVGVEVKINVRTREFARAIRQLRQSPIPVRLLVVDSAMPDLLRDAYQAEGIWILSWQSADSSEWLATLHSLGLAS